MSHALQEYLPGRATLNFFLVMTEPLSRELVEQLVAGEDSAARVIFDRYVERLLALARSRIGGKLRRRIDAEDVTQSAFRSFFVHAKAEEYELAQSGDLWRLLAGITLNKLYGQVEKHTAAKRHLDFEEANEAPLSALAARDPSGVEVVAMAEQLGLILALLTPDEREVLELTLLGKSVEAIAAEFGKSERTVRRHHDRARKLFEERLLEQGASRVSRARETFATFSPSHPSRLKRCESNQAFYSQSLTEPHTAGRASSGTRRESFATSDSSHPLLRFADFVLEQRIGEGSMGKVYRAKDKRNGKLVAVKTLHKSRQTESRAVAQFVQESQILAGWSHSHIVKIEGLGRYPGGGYFMVMEFVEGMNLQARLGSGPVALAEAVRIVRDVAGAIAYAHERGIVHCDLKPGNVMLDVEGRVFVADFGFAYLLNSAPNRRAGAVGGTLGFVAPEVLSGASRPTPAADIYAIGALLWVLVSGRVPEAGELLSGEEGLNAAIAAICRKCLAEAPGKRYRSAADITNELDRLLKR